MEIIHLILGKANPERMNGVNKVVHQLATQQTIAGKNVSVWGVTTDTRHNYPERVYTTQLFGASKFPFMIPCELKKAIFAKRTAVFHLHGGWIPLYSSLGAFFSRYGIRFVLTPHGAYNTIAMQRSKWRKKIYFAAFEKKLLCNTVRIHAIGETEVSGLATIFPNQKSWLMPYGFDAPDALPESLVRSNSFVIGFVGRLDVYTKGLDLLLAAFREFQKSHPAASLWIIGDGPGREWMTKYIQGNHLQNVVLWGKKFGLEKDTLLRQMHVFAHPSRNEGLPNAVLEAAALGVPSVVTAATNVARIVGEYQAGIAVKNESVEHLHQAFISMYRHYASGSAPALSANAYQMVQSAFSWKNLVHQYDQLYL